MDNRGHDVSIEGATAYSTLGWFEDPILSTFLWYPEEQLAGLVFHELAHQQVYVKDDTAFNESFATAIEQEGVWRWLRSQGMADRVATDRKRRTREADWSELLLHYRGCLDAVYNGREEETWKRGRKREIFEQLQGDYVGLKSGWGGYHGYDRWFAQDLNNADLASAGAYHRWIVAFQTLLGETGGDLTKLYQEAEQLAGLEKSVRTKRLAALSNQPSAPHEPATSEVTAKNCPLLHSR